MREVKEFLKNKGIEKVGECRELMVAEHTVVKDLEQCQTKLELMLLILTQKHLPADERWDLVGKIGLKLEEYPASPLLTSSS